MRGTVLFVLICVGLVVIDATKLSGYFFQITDAHLDNYYRKGSEEIVNHCRNGTGDAGAFGARAFCDSPVDLVKGAISWLANDVAVKPDFILWTGDNARHNDDVYVSKDLNETAVENADVATMITQLFPGVPVIPSIGNNDVYPHDTMLPGPNAVLDALANSWKTVLTTEMTESFKQTGFVVRDVDRFSLIGLNTIYMGYVDDCVYGDVHNNTSLLQLSMLNETVTQKVKEGKFVIISGHVPVNMWPLSCRAIYAKIVHPFRSMVKGHIYGHVHSDQYHTLNLDGSVDDKCIENNTIGITMAPSIVPTFNPALRVWKYDTSSFDIVDYTQYYADITTLNKGTQVQLKEEYSLVKAYNLENAGTLSQGDFWCNMTHNLQYSASLSIQYEIYKFVSAVSDSESIGLVCEKESWRC